ncbi:hypothetical protein BCR42DRAFT_427202 [Absidia repens]|uniref:Uncharacterized protein n=1 Tax=Absidia repens TaxID=90262 RepID=A0A1X2I0A1_9FUNG|nr:hypothetical protein BCR42DRAFT_427202 [Absidia repens]
MKTCGDSTLHTCSSYSDSLNISSDANSSMIRIHGNNSNNNTTTGIPIAPPPYSSIENNDLLDDYSASAFSSHTLSAPPPSPQDTSPLDSLFAQHLTSKLQQTFILTRTSATSPPASMYPGGAGKNDMDISSPSSPICATKSPSTATTLKTGQPSPVVMPGALPLTCTTTYHHQPTKLTTKHHGVDPHHLDYLLRRVSRNHHRHSAHGQPRSYRPPTTKRIGAFHKRPSRIPLYTKRLAKPSDHKDRQIMDCGNDGMNSARTINTTTSWKQSASRQKTLAITTAVEKWKQLKHYEQDDKNMTKSHEEVDRIVHDLKEMGL